MKPKVIKLKADLVGKSVPTNFGGASGRHTEVLLKGQGYPISQAPGPDIPAIEMEVKTRDLDAVSAHTAASMTPEDIIATPYQQSVVCSKIQRQYRVKTKSRVIVSAEVYNFSQPHIQELIQNCYETARQKIINGDQKNYIAGGYFGFFERSATGPRSYQFRLTDGAVKKLEAMAKSTFHKLFI